LHGERIAGERSVAARGRTNAGVGEPIAHESAIEDFFVGITGNRGAHTCRGVRGKAGRIGFPNGSSPGGASALDVGGGEICSAAGEWQTEANKQTADRNFR